VGRRLRVAWLGQRSQSAGDGLTTYSRETVAALRARGLDVVFFHHASGDGKRSIGLEALRVGGFRISPPRARRRLELELERARPDVVHVSLSFSTLDFQLPGICARRGIPAVATLHAPFDRRLTYWGGLSHVLYRLYAPALSRYDAVIVFGETQKRLLTESGVPARLIRIVPNAVDVVSWSPGPSRFRAGLEADLVFVYLGRINPEKNVDRLLDAFTSTAPATGVRLVMVGEGSERARLMRRFDDARVVWKGLVRDAATRADILRGADVFVLPSSIEGLSLATLEAMACGVCPLVTDVGCQLDAVDGAGIVLDVRSVDQELRMALRLLCAVPELAATLGALARARALEAYSLDLNVDRLVRLYDRLRAEARAA
jgi:glycosyltransferase involved in cell wall biosynthesis